LKSIASDMSNKQRNKIYDAREELAIQYVEKTFVPFDTDYGQYLTDITQKSNPSLIYFLKCYVKQNRSTTCGLVTLNIILNAKQCELYHSLHQNENLNVSQWRNNDLIPWIDESKMISAFYPMYCTNRKRIEKILDSGMNIKEFKCMMADFNFKSIQMVHCKHINSINDIRQFRKHCLGLSIEQVIICNYSLSRLEEHGGSGSGGGHFSTVIGFDQKSDCLLLLDCWTEKSWIKLTELFNAMCTRTADGQFRGYCVAKSIPNYMYNKWEEQQINDIFKHHNP